MHDNRLLFTATEWINEIESLFDRAKMSVHSKSNTIEVHSRMVIAGLCLLDPNFQLQYNADGSFETLFTRFELQPFSRFLSPRGKGLFETCASNPVIADLPLRRKTDDKLGRAAFAKFLTLRFPGKGEQEGAYSILLDGPWGSGKSTILNFMHKELECKWLDCMDGACRDGDDRESTKKCDKLRKHSDWIVVEFNAWRNQHVRPPWWSLMDAVFQQTKNILNPFAKAAEYWWRMVSGRLHYVVALVILAWGIAFALPFISDNAATRADKAADGGTSESEIVVWGDIADGMGKVVALIATLWGVAFAAGNSLFLRSSKSINAYLETIHDPMNRLKKRFETLVKRLGSKWFRPKRVAVFIDDLDRCKGDYAVELLEGIQTLFKETPVVFVVAADRRWLNACFLESYEKLEELVRSDPGKPLGMLYLEKTFQFCTSVPGITTENKRDYFYNLMKVKNFDETTMVRSVDMAKELVSGTAIDGNEKSVFFTDKTIDPQVKNALIDAAIMRLAAPVTVERTENDLIAYAQLLEPNPRAIKRLVNSYMVNKALSLITGNPIDLKPLALWTILSLRWPLLADHLAAHPDSITNVATGTVDSATAAPIAELLREKGGEVSRVIRGDGDEPVLTAEIVRQCVKLSE